MLPSRCTRCSATQYGRSFGRVSSRVDQGIRANGRGRPQALDGGRLLLRLVGLGDVLHAHFLDAATDDRQHVQA